MQSLKIIDHPEFERIIIEKKLNNWLKTEFPILCENWTSFSITVNKYFLPLQSNSFIRLKVVLRLISQNLQDIDHPVPEIKKYNDRHMAFLHKYTWILWQKYMSWHRKRWRIWICIFTIYCHRWSFSRILTQMIEIIFDSYIGPCLSPIEYSTTHDSCLKTIVQYQLEVLLFIFCLNINNTNDLCSHWENSLYNIKLKGSKV